jgi:hypothetical protein
MTPKQAETLKQICDCIVETIALSPDGLPAGHLYALLMGVLNLRQFEGVMSALESIGKVRKQGQLYFPQGPTQ